MFYIIAYSDCNYKFFLTWEDYVMVTGWLWIQAICAAVGGFLAWYLGDMDGFLYALIAFVVADFLTGIFCAIHDRALSSRVGWRGIFRKVCIFILLGVGTMLDRYVLLGENHIIRSAICFFYLSNEGISLLENAARLGLPIPRKLRDVLVQLRDRDKHSDESFDDLEETK